MSLAQPTTIATATQEAAWAQAALDAMLSRVLAELAKG